MLWLTILWLCVSNAVGRTMTPEFRPSVYNHEFSFVIGLLTSHDVSSKVKLECNRHAFLCPVLIYRNLNIMES